MPAIEIPASLFARLGKLAVPLVDTPVTVIEWLQRSEAAHPGKTARLVWKPKEEASST